MTIVLKLLLKYWKHILIVVTVSALLYLGYNKIYDRGYDKATVEYAEKLKAYEDKVDARIGKIEKLGSELQILAEVDSVTTRNAFNEILLATKGKQMYIIKDGKCSPSKDFIDAYNLAVDKANAK